MQFMVLIPQKLGFNSALLLSTFLKHLLLYFIQNYLKGDNASVICALFKERLGAKTNSKKKNMIPCYMATKLFIIVRHVLNFTERNLADNSIADQHYTYLN